MVVLVVDSVRLVLRNLERLLTTYGHDVVTAESGKQSLDVLKQDQRVNLVITELRLPDMTAIDLFRSTHAIERVSDHGQLEPPEFILFTHVRPDADAFSADVRLLNEVLDVGFLDVLFKPLVREKLLHHLRDSENFGSRKVVEADRAQKDRKGAKAVRTVNDELRRLDQKHQEFENRLNRLERNQEDIRHQFVEVRRVIAQFSSTLPVAIHENQTP